MIGHTYILTQDEELWEKELPANVETLLGSGRDALADRSHRGGPNEDRMPRDKTRVVSYRVPHNAAVQVYDYREKTARYAHAPSPLPPHYPTLSRGSISGSFPIPQGGVRA